MSPDLPSLDWARVLQPLGPGDPWGLNFPPESAERLLLASLSLEAAALVLAIGWLRRRIPRRSGRGAAAVLLAGLFFALPELALRVHLASLPRGAYLLDGASFWRLRPNLKGHRVDTEIGPMTVNTNSLGLRGAREVPSPKPRGEYRILCLGDSWTFGQGVADDETFCSRLEGILRQRSGKGFRVINGGQSGFSIIQAYLLFREIADRVQPDLVMLCGFNEYSQTRLPEQHALLTQSGVAGVLRRSLHQSVLYLALRNLVLRQARRLGLGDPYRSRRFISAELSEAYRDRLLQEIRARRARAVVFDHVSRGSPGWARPSQPPAEPMVDYLEVRPPSLIRDPQRFWLSPHRAHPSAYGHLEMARILADFLLSQPWFPRAAQGPAGGPAPSR